MLCENEQLFVSMLLYTSWDPMVMQVSSTGKENVHFKKRCILDKLNEFLANKFFAGLSVRKFNRYVTSIWKSVVDR